MQQEPRAAFGGLADLQSASADAASGVMTRHSADVSAGWLGKILLTDEEGAAALGVSVRKFAQLMHEPWFPPPIVLGPRLKRHVRAELEAAIAHMPRVTAPRSEPAQLLKSRVERAIRTGVIA